MFKKLAVLMCCLMVFLTGCSLASVNQLAPPAKGETVATIKTTMGDIKVKFFPSEAPKAVENFTKHAKDGYYKGVIFHRVMKDFMIQGGDPTGTGMHGESIWGQPFKDEFSSKLHNYRGALSMANSGPNTNGSQFFIVQVGSVDQNSIDFMNQNHFSSQVIEQYKKLGGTPWLDGKHTVFGQVYEGMDVVDKIAGVQVDDQSKPLEPVRITSVDVTTVE